MSDATIGRPDARPERNERWRAWLEANFVFVTIYSPDGKLLAANAAALAAAGVIAEEVVGRHCSQIGALAHSQEAIATLDEVIRRAAQGQTIRTRLTVRLRGARLTTIDCLICPLREPSGEVVEVAAAAVEIPSPQQFETSLARLDRELRLLSGCTKVLVRARTENELLTSICHIVVHDGGYPLAWVGRTQGDAADRIQLVARAGKSAAEPKSDELTIRALREHTTQLCRNVERDSNVDASPGFVSSIVLPLLAPEAPYGALTIHSERADAFDEGETTFLQELASDLTYGITALRAHAERERAQQRITRLTRILRMQSSINSAVLRIGNRNELLREACRVAVDLGGYARVVLSLVDPDGRCARPQFSAGTAQDFPEPALLPLSDGTEPDVNLSSRALRTGEVTVCSDLTLSEPPVAMREELVSRGFKSLVALPLLVEGRRVGVLTLASKDAALVEAEELLLLEDIMASLSAALRSQEQARAAQFLAYFDPLTGLAKRALFCERLEKVLRWRLGPQDCPAIAVFDVHHLSHINDSFGRHFGDLVLQRVAERLKAYVGSDEQLGYLGSGVFALIEPRLGGPEGAVTALLDDSVFGEPFAIEGRTLRLAYRSGVARFPLDGSDGDTLVQRAEAALKRAKESGEPYLHYQLDMRTEIAERLEMEHKLRTAIDERQFEIHYQPQLSMESGQIESLEALLRWNDPDDGTVLPGRFLPVLESASLIVAVGNWVLGRVVEDCERWSQLGIAPLRMAVNVSALQLRRKAFVPLVLALNERLGATGWGLDLEITESVLLHDLEGTNHKLRELRAAGVRVALDDFGTGYSALGLLSKLPVDLVKIDRSFVSGLPTDAPSALLVESIVRLATAFGLVTVAEGVESQAQHDALRSMGCTCWQGHFHSPALRREELERKLIPRLIKRPGE